MAMAMYMKAAEQGNPESQHIMLDVVTLRVMGLSDKLWSLHWYMKAAKQGCIFNVGCCYSMVMELSKPKPFIGS
jgi:TPR repeat protein